MVPNPRKVARALRATVAAMAALGALTLVECGSGGGPDDAGRAQRSSAFGGGTITSGGGGLSIVHVGSAFTGSGTSGNPLELAGLDCSGSAVSAINAYGSATCISAGGGGGGVYADSPLAGSGSSGSHLTFSPSVTAPFAGTGSSGSPFAYVPVVSTGLGGTGSAGNPLVANLAGGTCTAGQVVTAVSSAGVATCSDPAQNSYLSAYGRISEEFLGRNNVISTTLQGGTWTCTASGTPAACMATNDTASAGRPGRMTSTMASVVSANDLEWRTGLASFFFNSGDTYRSRTVLGFPTLSTSTDGYNFKTGFWDTDATIDQANGCYFLYDERQGASAPTTGSRAAAGVNKLNCVCASASSRTEYPMDGSTVSDESFTTVNAPVGAVTWPNTNVLDLLVVVTGTTRAEFYVGGVKSCDINSHVPSTGLAEGIDGFRNGAATATRTIQIDYMSVDWTLGSARSP